MPAPLTLFRRLAVAEAVTWALLLLGMFLKYVTETTELGVRIFGMVHGVVFIAYCLVTILVAVDGRWTAGKLTLGLLAAIPPFFTIWFDRWVEKRDALRADDWRLRTEPARGGLERIVAVGVTRPLASAAVLIVAIAALTGLALFVGPPTSHA